MNFGILKIGEIIVIVGLILLVIYSDFKTFEKSNVINARSNILN